MSSTAPCMWAASSTAPTATLSCRPATAGAAAAAPDGATVLSFFSARPEPGPAEPHGENRLVQKIDLTDGIWDGEFDRFGLASMNNRARMRVLRDDPATGENTYITATIPFRHGERAERHPVVQEFFLLAGELAGNTGIMQAGAYCFRPEMVAHGPYGSRTGALILFRSLGGAQATLWEDALPFSFTPPHQPVLPPDLAALGQPMRVRRATEPGVDNARRRVFGVRKQHRRPCAGKRRGALTRPANRSASR